MSMVYRTLTVHLVSGKSRWPAAKKDVLGRDWMRPGAGGMVIAPFGDGDMDC